MSIGSTRAGRWRGLLVAALVLGGASSARADFLYDFQWDAVNYTTPDGIMRAFPAFEINFVTPSLLDTSGEAVAFPAETISGAVNPLSVDKVSILMGTTTSSFLFYPAPGSISISDNPPVGSLLNLQFTINQTAFVPGVVYATTLALRDIVTATSPFQTTQYISGAGTLSITDLATQPQPVPEPATGVLLASGLLAGVLRRRTGVWRLYSALNTSTGLMAATRRAGM